MGYPLFPGSPPVPSPCPHSDPGRPGASRPFSRRSGAVPRPLNRKTPTSRHFSGLNVTASALAVYASCPPLDGLRNTRFRLADLPLPDGYRTRWTAQERFSFQMFYVIFLPPHSQGLPRRDSRRDSFAGAAGAGSGERRRENGVKRAVRKRIRKRAGGERPPARDVIRVRSDLSCDSWSLR